MNRLRYVSLLVLSLLWATRVCAGTVAVLQPHAPSAEATETVARMRGELMAVGLGVVITERPSDVGTDARSVRQWLESLVTNRGIDAVIAVTGEDTPVDVDVWVPGDSPRRFEVLRVTVDRRGGNVPEKLAIRAIEILRSRLLEMDFAARDRVEIPDKPLPADADVETRQDTGASSRIGVSAGAGSLVGMDGIGPAIAPMLRAEWGASAAFGWQFTVVGWGSRPRISKNGAAASVSQQLALLGGNLRLGDGRSVWPYVAFAVGGLRSAIDGQATSPQVGRGVVQWSALFDVGLGAGIRLTDRTFLSTEAHGQFAAPYVQIHFSDTVVATSGRPNLLFALALGVWL